MTQTIDIGICTFRRPQITETLQSLAHLDIPAGCTLRVIVADNDDTPSAQETVTMAELPFDVLYVHAPGRNISIARNAILDAATADYLAYIDDDETADPAWLVTLYATAIEHTADVVFGPALSVYPPEAQSWMVDGDYHSTTQPDGITQVQTGATCNVLIDRGSQAVQGARFDLDLGRSGGEDTVFFYGIAQRGGTLWFAHGAKVFEKVEPKRLSLGWLIERKIRSGQSYAVAQLQDGSNTVSTRVSLCLKAAAKAVYCAGGMIVSLPSQDRRNYWIIRGALHIGVIKKCFGQREKTLYGQTS
jgi:succinoglycan biosynthesis protein ExoM